MTIKPLDKEQREYILAQFRHMPNSIIRPEQLEFVLNSMVNAIPSKNLKTLVFDEYGGTLGEITIKTKEASKYQFQIILKAFSDGKNLGFTLDPGELRQHIENCQQVLNVLEQQE